MNNTIKTHGGRRLGAGRKPGHSVAQPTTVIRVPVNTTETIKNFVSALKRKHTLQGQAGVVDLIQFAQAKQRVILPLYTSKVSAGFPSRLMTTSNSDSIQATISWKTILQPSSCASKVTQ